MGRVIPFRNAQLLSELQRLLAQPRTASELLSTLDEAVASRAPREMDDPELEAFLDQAKHIMPPRPVGSFAPYDGPIDVRFGPRTYMTDRVPLPGDWMERADHSLQGGRRLYYNTRSGLGWDASVLDAWRPSEPFVRRRLMRRELRPRTEDDKNVAKLIAALQSALESP